MASPNAVANVRPPPDDELVAIADYVTGFAVTSGEAYETAAHCLMDTLGCGVLALRFPECAKHLGPLVPGVVVPNGARVPGTPFVLDPVKAAWDIGCMIRWLDFNDTWLAAEWGHPSDNLGGILAVADYVSRTAVAAGKPPLLMRDVLTAMIKAHEIQGCLALENSFNRVGLDHVLLVRVASAAVITHLLGGTAEQVVDALSHAFVDGSALRTYRQAPNAGPRKSWAAGDATSRAVRLAFLVLKGEIGIPGALTAPTWGFYDVAFNGQRFRFQRPYGSHVMENVLFKISYPAEFHAQTAVEAAVKLHPEVGERLDDVERVLLTTHESAIRIISKTGPLANPADRDHCLQYMTAVGLVDYEDAAQRTRVSIGCASAWRWRRTRATAANTTSRTSAASPTRCRCSSPAARQRQRWPWSTPSDIVAVVPRGCRCWSRNSSATWRRAFPPGRPADPRLVFGFGAGWPPAGVRIHGFCWRFETRRRRWRPTALRSRLALAGSTRQHCVTRRAIGGREVPKAGQRSTGATRGHKGELILKMFSRLGCAAAVLRAPRHGEKRWRPPRIAATRLGFSPRPRWCCS